MTVNTNKIKFNAARLKDLWNQPIIISFYIICPILAHVHYVRAQLNTSSVVCCETFSHGLDLIIHKTAVHTILPLWTFFNWYTVTQVSQRVFQYFLTTLLVCDLSCTIKWQKLSLTFLISGCLMVKSVQYCKYQ